MVKNTHPSIRIDLNEFKLHIDLKKGTELTLHFNSPSRMFYLSVIALVVSEMKQLGKITSIPLEKHLDLLALLNESVGGSAGSSDKKNLSQRIYRKWKDALPNLEEAPLYKVLGRKEEYDEGIGKTYLFTEAEKDSWANLFEYKGSEENVRLKFSIDKIGASLDDVVIAYGGALDGDAWERFLSSLKGQVESVPEMEAVQSRAAEPAAPASPIGKQGTVGQRRQFWVVLVTVIVVIAGVAAMAIWKLHFGPASVKVASTEKMAFPLPDKPSIAVLPFVNISKDPKQDPITDGMTEEIINALSKVPEVFVIARNSTFVYKGKTTDVRQVAEALGVQYILEGSVRMSGGTVRVTAQLIDAINGHHLWSERYDRSVKDVFALQDEITMRILTELRVKLTHSEEARILEKGTNNLQAYLKVVEGDGYFDQQNKEANAVAMRLYREALELDPRYAMAYSRLSRALSRDVSLGASESPQETLANALKLAQKADELDGSSAEALATVSWVFMNMRQHDKAIEYGERAVRLNPNSSFALHTLAISLSGSWRGEEALPLHRQAIRLNPFVANYHMMLGAACRQTGRYEEGIAAEKKALKLAPNNLWANIQLVSLYMYAGCEDEARAAVAEIHRIDPNYSLEKFSKFYPVKEGSQRDRLIDALRKAGLK
ncbi:MAG: tetratricopeptide repeat protein [Syntrophales bacterium]